MEQEDFRTMFGSIELGAADAEEPGDDEDRRVRAWRAEQLHRLGLPWSLALTWAPHVDWHEVARLVSRGCSPALAIEIVR